VALQMNDVETREQTEQRLVVSNRITQSPRVAEQTFYVVALRSDVNVDTVLPACQVVASPTFPTHRRPDLIACQT